MKIDFKTFGMFDKAPTRAAPGLIRFDLHWSHDIHCHPRSYTIIQNDIAFEIPPKYFGKIHPRSSFAQLFTDIGGKVIDSDYRGRVSVVFLNFSSNWLFIKKGERFAWIVFQKIADYEEHEEVEELVKRPAISVYSAQQTKMPDKLFTNRYVPEYVKPDLKWYERDYLPI